MLRDASELTGLAIFATDGGIGHVKDCYFDDESWVIRYLVVETGTWLSNRRVLLSPLALGEPDWLAGRIPTRLTRGQVRGSPGVDTDMPVSRQHEVELSGYYGYPPYWGSVGPWGSGYYPGALLTGTGYAGSGADYLAAQVEQERQARESGTADAHDRHLRSCKAVTGYHIGALDGDIGHVRGMLVDPESWALRYLVVDTSNWWLGHQLLVAPRWITNISWPERSVMIDLTREDIRAAPAYDPGAALERPQEALMHDHYGRTGYWHDEVLASAVPRLRPSEERAPG
jgi:hypothetical protein